jgi:hypothetical protein
MFPFVFFANKPFDKENIKKDDDERDKETQLDAFNVEQASYELENPDFDMFNFDVSTYSMLTLQRRIRGEKWQIPLGTIIIPELGRNKMELGGLAVSIVHTSAIGQIGLGWSRGERSSGTGIGISIGYNKQ